MPEQSTTEKAIPAGQLEQDLTADIISTLYGIDISEVKKTGDAPEGILYGHRCEIELGFMQDGKPETLAVMRLNIPFGKSQATPADFEALQARLAELISAKSEVPVRAATWDEICQHYEDEYQEQQAAMFKQYMDSVPKEALYSA